MLENIAIIISFLALIVGIIGNTWDKEKKGINKITITGWLTIVIGLSAGILGIYKNINTQQELNWQNIQRQNIRRLSYNKLFEVTFDRIRVIRRLYFEVHMKFPISNLDTTRSILNQIDNLKSKRFLHYLDSININDIPEGMIIDKRVGISWREILTRSEQKFSHDINELWNKFSQFYNIETLVIMDSVLVKAPNSDKVLRDVNLMSTPTVSHFFAIDYIASIGGEDGEWKQLPRNTEFIDYINLLKRLYINCQQNK